MKQELYFQLVEQRTLHAKNRAERAKVMIDRMVRQQVQIKSPDDELSFEMQDGVLSDKNTQNMGHNHRLFKQKKGDTQGCIDYDEIIIPLPAQRT